jgi:hypothetical protein
MQLFNAHHHRTLCESLRAFLRAELGSSTRGLDDEALLVHCSESVDICAELGLADRRSMTWLAATRLVVGPRFHEHAVLRRLLADRSLPPEKRIENLLAEATPLDWHEAAMLGAGAARPGSLDVRRLG